MRLAAALVAALLMQPTGPAVRVLDRGGQSGIEEPRQVVATTAAEFEALWRQHSTRPVPAVDFRTESVIGIFLGTRTTAGYGVEILSIERLGSGSVVRCRELVPPADAVAAQVLTFPYVVVAAPALVRPVRFECVR